LGGGGSNKIATFRARLAKYVPPNKKEVEGGTGEKNRFKGHSSCNYHAVLTNQAIHKSRYLTSPVSLHQMSEPKN